MNFACLKVQNSSQEEEFGELAFCEAPRKSDMSSRRGVGHLVQSRRLCVVMVTPGFMGGSKEDGTVKHATCFGRCGRIDRSSTKQPFNELMYWARAISRCRMECNTASDIHHFFDSFQSKEISCIKWD
ncbi:hypothetical protein HNY73_003279 [Argiope bruennichi]|uniref:Uncharacterized protein n=1 Tax=Argiope bruennichi TaxID=94029 RepID=A0A8T0FWH2_ARGBR|nr:hypothetical protein HNY73_003279 [Argiope bruennichi]